MPPRIDAADIPDTAILWRRVDPSMIDKVGNVESLQSWAYKDQNHELSVYVANETTAEAVLAAGKPDQLVVRITAGFIRSLGYKVVRDPEPDNPAHCIIDPYPQKKADRKAMALASSWELPEP